MGKDGSCESSGPPLPPEQKEVASGASAPEGGGSSMSSGGSGSTRISMISVLGFLSSGLGLG